MKIVKNLINYLFTPKRKFCYGYYPTPVASNLKCVGCYYRESCEKITLKHIENNAAYRRVIRGYYGGY